MLLLLFTCSDVFLSIYLWADPHGMAGCWHSQALELYPAVAFSPLYLEFMNAVLTEGPPAHA